MVRASKVPAGSLGLFALEAGTARWGREFDLPPKWDGRDVAWGAWEVGSDSVGGMGEPCSRCDSFDLALHATGYGTDDDSDYRHVTVPSLSSDGRGSTRVRERVRPPLILHVTRCPSCGRDEVHDPLAGVCELDDGDYGPQGSTCTDDDYADLDPIDRWDGRPEDLGPDEDGIVPTTW